MNNKREHLYLFIQVLHSNNRRLHYRLNFEKVLIKKNHPNN